ncbi:hypothetical protein GCM10009608_61580 [Pseudonocardia alaniniphila]
MCVTHLAQGVRALERHRIRVPAFFEHLRPLGTAHLHLLGQLVVWAVERLGAHAVKVSDARTGTAPRLPPDVVTEVPVPRITW